MEPWQKTPRSKTSRRNRAERSWTNGLESTRRVRVILWRLTITKAEVIVDAAASLSRSRLRVSIVVLDAIAVTARQYAGREMERLESARARARAR